MSVGRSLKLFAIRRRRGRPRVAKCRKGHAFTAENTLMDRGHRRCRTCLETKRRAERMERKGIQHNWDNASARWKTLRERTAEREARSAERKRRLAERKAEQRRDIEAICSQGLNGPRLPEPERMGIMERIWCGLHPMGKGWV